jgi:midasin
VLAPLSFSALATPQSALDAPAPLSPTTPTDGADENGDNKADAEKEHADDADQGNKQEDDNEDAAEQVESADIPKANDDDASGEGEQAEEKERSRAHAAPAQAKPGQQQVRGQGAEAAAGEEHDGEESDMQDAKQDQEAERAARKQREGEDAAEDKEKEQSATAPAPSSSADQPTRAPDASRVRDPRGRRERAQPQPSGEGAEEEKADEQREQRRAQQRAELNPLRSPGDALKQWRERVHVGEKAERDEENGKNEQQQEKEEAVAEMHDAEAEEYQHVGAQEEADAQAMAPAPEAAPPGAIPEEMEDEKAAEDESRQQGHEEENAMSDEECDDHKDREGKKAGGEEEDEAEEIGRAGPRGRLRLAPRGRGRATEEKETKDDAKQESQSTDDAAATAAAALFDPMAQEHGAPDTLPGAVSAPGADATDFRQGGQREAPLAPEQIEALREQLDAELAAFSMQDENGAQSERRARALSVWRKLEATTSELAQQLCEQLRTVLEPTVAARLRGDFRSGKRLNVRRLIPYIASQFRRDKIWLRRTRPSRRQYQVLLAVDDSASMLSNGGGRLALEAIAVLSRALSQLEAGQLGVVSFGERVRLLHAFGQPWGEETASFTVGGFSFAQRETRFPQLLEAAVSILESARASGAASGGGTELLQLAFIVTDARIHQDREVVARWTREAASRGQLMVLLIVDTPDETRSILQTKTVEFGPSGQLRMREYLEDFPFPFYVVVRHSSALPLVVSDALRQWFELVARSR